MHNCSKLVSRNSNNNTDLYNYGIITNMQKLPNPDKAVVDIDKLVSYCLNPEHQDGQHKARVFKASLNLGIDEVQVLRIALFEAVCNQFAVISKPNEYGQRYIIDFEINHSGKNAKIRSAWIVRNDEDFPRLITCYVL